MEETAQNTVLSIKGLTKTFGAKRVLTDVSFDVHQGEIFGLLGPNGSGKTTTIKLALGLLNLQKGSVKICNHDIQSEFEKAMECVGAIVENPELYKNLTGMQNLMQYCRMYKGITSQRLDWAIRVAGLQNRINEKVSRYSLGMRQRLGIAQALLNSPKLLILDEPTNGLDPEGIKLLREFLIDLAHNHKVAVLVSSHLLSELENLCDTVGVINSGRIVGIRTMNEIKNYKTDGLIQFKVKVDDVARATEYFNANSIPHSVNKNGFVYVKLTEEQSETIVAQLVFAGINITTFARVERSLEDAFMDMISKSGGSRI